MSGLEVLLVVLVFWIPCAVWVGRETWREPINVTFIEKIAATGWTAALGGLAIAGAILFVISLVVVVIDAIV